MVRHGDGRPEIVMPFRGYLLFAMAVLASCNSATASADADKKIWISATRLVLTPQDTTRIGLITSRNGQFLFSSGIKRDPGLPTGPSGRWSSSDSAIVAVEPGGLVRAKAPGQAVLTVELDNLSESAIFFVRDHDGTHANFVTVDVGLAHACATTNIGEVYCWGISWFGELGLGNTRQFTSTVSPTRVPGLQGVVDLSVGLRHSCALDSNYRAHCWGEDLVSGAGRANPSPLPVPTEQRFTDISAGGTFSCGATATGALFCWGIGFSGVQPVSAPTKIVSISVGYSHACGLSEGGSLYCFGSNASGQLGTGDRLSRAAMAAVNSSSAFLQVSAGFDYTCAVSADKKAYCWGLGAQGRLGTGLTTSFDLPTPIAGLDRVASIDAGAVHTCAVSETGAPYCWGEEFRGQLGNGPPPSATLTAEDLIQLVPVPVSLDEPMGLISAGWGESTCALSAVSAAFCWGLNTNGQLGVGRHDFAAGSPFRFSEWPLAVRLVR